MFCSHYHPPIPKNPSLYKQTELSPVTPEELLEYRKLPTYTPSQHILHILYFLVFGIIKLVMALTFALLAGPVFILCCTAWRSLGRPESGRLFLRGVWASMSRILLLLLGFVRVTFVGDPDSDARFVVSNHVCFFDGWFFLAHLFRPLGKKELLRIPCLKDMADVYDAIPVDRTRSSGITKLLTDNAKDSTKPPICMMPEGASTSGDYMLRFHLGAFLSDLPVQLVTIRYRLWGTTREVGHISFFHQKLYHLIVFLGVPFITVEIRFLEAMSLKEIADGDPRVLADTAGLRIANALGVRILGLTSSALFKQKTD
jgi:hypothetical protein